MKFLKKQLLTAAFFIVMSITILSVKSQAADAYSFVITQGNNLIEVTDQNANDILGDGTVSYDKGSNTLTLNNCNFEAPPTNAYYNMGIYKKDSELNIKLIGENTIKGGINVTNGITVSGDGILNVTTLMSNSGYLSISGSTINASSVEALTDLKIYDGAHITAIHAGMAFPIYAQNELYIENSTVTGISESDSYFSGIYAYNGPITIIDSTVHASSKNDIGITSNGDISIKGGKLTTNAPNGDAIFAVGSLLVADDAQVTSNGLWSALFSEKNITISDSTVNAAAAATDVNAIRALDDITITNSVIRATGGAGYYGIYSDTTTSVSGSWIHTSGNETFEGQITDSVLINGTTGQVIGHVTLPNSIELTADTELSIPADASLTIPTKMTFTNNGKIHLLGKVLNHGTALCGEASHAGGTSSCLSKAACGICGNEYGDFAPHNTTHRDKVDAACDKDGNIEYWHCDICGKYFADENLTSEISQEDTVAKATGHPYKDGICTICGAKDPDYVPPAKTDTEPQQENPGNMNSSTTKLSTAKSNLPQTGDTNVSTLWMMLMFAASSIFIGTFIYTRKKR